jgi:hypothetical protein
MSGFLQMGLGPKKGGLPCLIIVVMVHVPIIVRNIREAAALAMLASALATHAVKSIPTSF